MDKYSKNPKETIEESIDEFYGFEYEEYELDEHEEDYEHPFDADKIRIDQQMLSLKYLTELMNEKQIILNPGFQRNRVWTERKRKSLLIESLMLRIPIPAFYFYENEDSKFIVIDGLQRLSTINDFINDKFKLFGLEYLENYCGGKTFSELDIKYQQRIFRTQLAVNILDARSPSNVVFDIFRRVNTGGVSLKPQEIRNAISKNSTRDLLKTLYKSDEFQIATRNRIKDDRMDGQEFILRFFAFYKSYNHKNRQLNYTSGNIAVFLDNALLDLNEAKNDELAVFKEDFKRAMNISNILFREYTFRKCYINENNRIYSNMDIINKALYTSWAVILSNPKFINFDFTKLGTEVLQRLAQELTADIPYDSYLTQGTNSTKSVQYSFHKANMILSEVMGFDF
ncbi:DUF262 domain-containing protein [Bacillus cereus]|uniref:DUF262 domain-containing protein n=1 Tax=Bacillus cereus TaxID=1396 RepID=UPI001F38ED6A|nr:DUF262 domain-containing protein [Bacillus cereus]UIJ67292.1 DUF262 domain-containing protein [Bacillus cereus]